MYGMYVRIRDWMISRISQSKNLSFHRPSIVVLVVVRLVHTTLIIPSVFDLLATSMKRYPPNDPTVLIVQVTI